MPQVSDREFLLCYGGGLWDANPQVKLELIRAIGGLDAEENKSFFEPSYIVQDSIGNLYTLDSGNPPAGSWKIISRVRSI